MTRAKSSSTQYEKWCSAFRTGASPDGTIGGTRQGVALMASDDKNSFSNDIA